MTASGFSLEKRGVLYASAKRRALNNPEIIKRKNLLLEGSAKQNGSGQP